MGKNFARSVWQPNATQVITQVITQVSTEIAILIDEGDIMKSALKQTLYVSALLGLGAAAYPVSAHHSTTMFAHDKVVSISGVVKEVHWTNPHVAIYVEGAAKGDKPATWVLEMTSPGNLMRAGVWKRNSFKPGDKVDVDMAPLRDGGRGGALKKITNTESGMSLNANLREQEGVVEK